MSSLDLALWYASKAKLCLREGEKYFTQFRCPECASSFEESIEFSTKAICEFLQENYKPKHDISDALIELSTRFPDYKEQLTRSAWISSRWVGMAQRARNLVRYGNQAAKVPATEIVQKKDTVPIRADAYEICRLLDKVEGTKKFAPPMRLGILDGYFDESHESEKPCAAYPYTDFRIDNWEKRFAQFILEGKNKFVIERIPMSKVSNHYCLIINPFGEAYPERDIKNRLSFNILKNYILDGGLLVNVAGFPFFYAWDVISGKQEPIVDKTTLLPRSIRIDKGQVFIDQFVTMIDFAGSLLWREFDVLTTSDTPEFSGINQLEIIQKEEDKSIAGDLTTLGGNKVNEFRAVRSETKNAIPLIRAFRPDFKEVYPIAAIQLGFGYLVIGGMHNKTSAEFEKLANAVNNFSEWLSKKP